MFQFLEEHVNMQNNKVDAVLFNIMHQAQNIGARVESSIYELFRTQLSIRARSQIV
jgi:hypothetical protein